MFKTIHFEEHCNCEGTETLKSTKILWNTKPCFRRNGLGHIGLHGTNCVVGTASLAEDGQQVYSSKVFLIFYQWPHTWACCKLDC